MLMNSKFDGYVFGQASSPATRAKLRAAARRGHPGARRVVAAQNQLGAFGDDEEQGSGIKSGDPESSNFDPNGWPGSSPDNNPPTPPPAPPPAGGGYTINDLKGVGSSVTTGVDAAADVYNKVKGAVAPVVAQINSQGAANASTPAGNVGAQNPSRIAAAVQAFRTAVSAFISNPCAANVNNALAAFHTALDTYSNDPGNPPVSTATIIARISAALTVAVQAYDDTYNAYLESAVKPAGPSYVAASPAAARMASRTMVAGAPSAAKVAAINAAAGLTTADSGSGIGGGAIALGLGVIWFLMK